MKSKPDSQHESSLLEYASSRDKDTEASRNGQQYLEIRIGSGRKWAGLVGFALVFLAVCGVLVILFVRFTSSLRLAVGLVVFLVSYMLLMGWWASRNVEDRYK
ncbi:hypothetical protein [Fontivita pretiosa]|uniref:hypothetical protein n=1 Tax=Fontivita pretiosa TaxID=2989684 RepID=UPI003D16AE8A